MAIPTTLLAYQTGRRLQFTTERTAAQSQLSDIQLTTLPQARKANDDLAKQSVDLNKQIATLKQAIEHAATAADAKDLSDKLEEASIALRSANANQVEAQRKITALTDSRDSLSAAIDTLTREIGAAQAAEAAATARQKRIQDATAALGAAPFNGIVAAATAALAAMGPADARIAAAVPADLLTRAVDRRKNAAQALADAATATSSAQALASDSLQTATATAESVLFNYVAQAPGRLDSANAAINQAADPTVAPLTEAESDRLADATLVADGTAAIAEEKLRDDAQADLNTKQAALDDAVLQAREVDIDTDPATVQAVIDAAKDRDDAQAAVEAANAAFTGATRDDLHRWEAALPEANWKLVDQLEEARAALSDLKGLNPASLPAPLTLAEAAWVADLYAIDKQERTARWIAAEVQARTSAQEFETNMNRYRRLTALRGDL